MPSSSGNSRASGSCGAGSKIVAWPRSQKRTKAQPARRNEIFRTPGRFGWDGGLGTSAYTDPVEGMIGILFTQRMMDSPEPPRIYNDFWTLAYSAME
jgi:CubicO group peptidase (beta-lactamase class C family)